MKSRVEAMDATRIPDDEVAQQLDRLLESEMFKASKRSRTFLSYVVNQRVAGQVDNLREKVIGVEAFGRSSGYDTTDDPVVRVTAGEVRKRLAQYYQDPARAGELRFELLPGSYVPEFHRPVVAVSAQDPAPELPVVALSAERPHRGWILAGVLALLAAASLWVGRNGLGGASAFERFWEPTLRSPGPVLLSVGQGRVYSLRKDLANAAEADLDPSHSGVPAHALSKDFPVTAKDILPSWDRYVPLGDAVSMAGTAVFLRERKKEFRLRGSGTTTLADLREGAAVLFGAFSNDWTLRINKDLRFQVAIGPDGWRYIEDKQNPASRVWRGNQVNGPLDVEFTDYAVLTRVFDLTTGHAVMSVGGITHLGTRAGGEFLLSEEKLNEALRGAPQGWEKKNLQIVVSTKVIGASASPPQFLALHVW